MTIKAQKDVVYDERHGQALDLYEPDRGNGCALIAVHGGGWFQGDKAKDEDLGRALAEAGYLVAVPNYRLAPEHLFPAAREDIFAVYDWLGTNGPGAKGIGVTGASSGGNLAVELGLAKGIPVVSWSGVIDLDGWIERHPDVIPEQDRKTDAANTPSAEIDQGGPEDTFYKWFVLTYTGGDPAKLRDASLLHRVGNSSGPMLLVNSMNELCPVDAVLKLQEQLLAAGVPVMTKFLPGGRHAKGYMDDAMDYTLDFFKEYLLKQRP